MDQASDPASGRVLDDAAATSAAARWRERWGEARAEGAYLRHGLRSHWVRFHMLPHSKRYPDTREEWREVLRRHHALLAMLAASTAASHWLLSVPTYEADRLPGGRSAPCADWSTSLGTGVEWQTYPPDEFDESVRHVWMFGLDALDGKGLDPLLRAVADEQVGHVIIGPPDWAWLYHPYDGGADVIADDDLREVIVREHRDWLAPGPSGL